MHNSFINFLAEFNNRGPGSNFQKILFGIKGQRSKLRIKVEMKMTRKVKRAMYMANVLKKHGDICHYYVSLKFLQNRDNMIDHESLAFEKCYIYKARQAHIMFINFGLTVN